MSISLATMGKFNYQLIKGGGIIQEEIEIKKPSITVKYINNIPLSEKLKENENLKELNFSKYKNKPNIQVQLFE
jgi:hypothetical protein